jgi:hypothetical protein
MDRSSILLLASCSNTKDASSSDSAYDSPCGLSKLLPNHSAELLRKRRNVLQLVRGGSISRQGVPLSDLPYNAKIQEGPDFGGDRKGVYRPAILTYCGRFYSELGLDRLEKVETSRHHLLILSGLYGLVDFAEPIQPYSCHVLDAQQIAGIWKIKRIFDLTAESAYRDLVDWSRVRRKIEVLRVFGEQNAGPGLLRALGNLTYSELLGKTEDELLSLRTGASFFTKYERVTIRNSDDPPSDFPREPEELFTPPDLTEPQGKLAGVDETSRSESGEEREIPVTSGGNHSTAFGGQINSLGDIPPEFRRPFEQMSKAYHVSWVHLIHYKSHNVRSDGLVVSLTAPKRQMGKIHGKLRGRFKVPGTQEFEIDVTKGKEEEMYNQLLSLLSDYRRP